MHRISPYFWLIFVGIFTIALLIGLGGPGLWDPWEMDRAHVAWQMTQPPGVLVMESSGSSSSVASSLSKSLENKANVQPLGDGPPMNADWERARAALGEKVFRVAVLDIDSPLSSSEKSSINNVAVTLQNMIRHNPSTRFFLFSSSGRFDPADTLASMLTYLRHSDREDAQKDADAISRQTQAVSAADLSDAVECVLWGHSWLAQFKLSGETRFLPPLDSWVMSLSMKIFGHHEFAVRLPNFLYSVLLLVVVAFIAGQNPSRRLVALLILASSPLFILSARFAIGQMSAMLLLTLGVWTILHLEKGLKWVLPRLLLLGILLYLAMGMMGALLLFLVVAAIWVICWDHSCLWRWTMISCAGLMALLACITFLPDNAVFDAFRFTSATFAGGLKPEYRSFDFILREIGFGFFPWIALLPVLAVMLKAPQQEEKTFLPLLAWALVPLLVLMVAIRPWHHYLYAGIPAFALLLAMAQTSQGSIFRSRWLAFIAVGLFVVIFKDLHHNPVHWMTGFTTDPSFAEPGKGDAVAPYIRLGWVATLGAGLAGFALLVGGGRISSWIISLPKMFSQRKFWLWVLWILIALVALDIGIFIALKWGALVLGQDRGAVLLRILLTGPDIALLYGAIVFVVIMRHWNKIRPRLSRLFGDRCLDVSSKVMLWIEKPRSIFVLMTVGALLMVGSLHFSVVGELSYHLSQKHLLKTWEQSSQKVPGKLLFHGKDVKSLETNFYLKDVPVHASRQDLITTLKDSSRRTFWLLPRNLWSEVLSSVRGFGGTPVLLDDRSSRLVLAASSLAPGEEDANWLARATFTQETFDALGVEHRHTATFEDKIRFVGYALDRPMVSRGGTAQLKMYFQALDKIPVSYRIFMHIDRQGASSRIHGDHWILNQAKESEDQNQCIGCFATNHWIKDDIVEDTYSIKIPIGALSGTYDIWMGFYTPSNDRRLSVRAFDSPKVRHDGQNRVRIGTLIVQ